MKNLKIKSAILALSLGLMQLLYGCGAASDTDAVETTSIVPKLTNQRKKQNRMYSKALTWRRDDQILHQHQ